LENLTDKDHIRGAFKAYRKEKAFLQIGGLKPAMGWDTVDELLCKFYHWKIVTDASFQVKHFKTYRCQLQCFESGTSKAKLFIAWVMVLLLRP